jgi:hypothetical protein
MLGLILYQVLIRIHSFKTPKSNFRTSNCQIGSLQPYNSSLILLKSATQKFSGQSFYLIRRRRALDIFSGTQDRNHYPSKGTELSAAQAFARLGMKAQLVKHG